MSSLLLFSQSINANSKNSTVIWKCPDASAIHVKRRYHPRTYEFEWKATIVSSTGVSILMWGIHNPRFPTSVKGTILYDDQVLLCKY